ncbi:MAG: glycosyltransferase family 39 protein [Bacteroidetes bacterium]|nr:MAG: glycosyltransferase family 39 protein [Bacteroidota bacterium]
MHNKINIDKGWFWILFGMITVVHLLGMLCIDIMDVDAAQYASISREMLESGEFLQVQHRHADYLDKPPLLFWVTALSFKVFGISGFAFRLPSFLFLLLGIYATFRLGKMYYDRRTGQLAALVLYSSQAYFLFSHDVRTDTILANVLIFGLWQLAVFLRERTMLSVILAAVGIGLAMLEKGPIGLMVAIWALGSEIAYQRNWKAIFRWEWLIGLAVLGAVLAPMSYGLYRQFGWDGLEFYYWTQSFGRITGQNEWSDDSTIFYFVHTFLWAFLPWTFFAIYGVGKSLVELIKSKLSGLQPREVFTLGGFVITFAAMSLSHYKLPHYIFVVFPFIAIIAARTIWEVIDSGKGQKVFLILQWVIFSTAWLLVAVLSAMAFSLQNWLVIIVAVLMFGASAYMLIIKRTGINQLIYSALFTIIGLNFVLNTHFYPTLLAYQSGTVAGRYIVEKQLPTESIYFFAVTMNSLDFYSRSIIEIADEKFIADASGIWIFTNEPGKDKLAEIGINFVVDREFDHFDVTKLSLKFLNPARRSEVVAKDYLLRIE